MLAVHELVILFSEWPDKGSQLVLVYSLYNQTQCYPVSSLHFFEGFQRASGQREQVTEGAHRRAQRASIHRREVPAQSRSVEPQRGLSELLCIQR